MPISRAGTVLPTMISRGDSGETSNCSNVPSSRSRATDSAVTIRPISVVKMATRPGTVFQVLSEFGLNQIRGGHDAGRRMAQGALSQLVVEAGDDVGGIAGHDLRGVRAAAVENQLHAGRPAGATLREKSG